MHLLLLLACLALTTTGHFLVSAHMIPEDRLSTRLPTPCLNSTSNPLSASIQSDSPPVVIVELPKAVRKNKTSKKQKKSKVIGKKRTRPPANCVPLWGSCKSPGKVCCDTCAFCQCRLFKTVCVCRMGNPHC